MVKVGDRIFIPIVPRMKWGEDADNSFVRSAQFTLNALGERWSEKVIQQEMETTTKAHQIEKEIIGVMANL